MKRSLWLTLRHLKTSSLLPSIRCTRSLNCWSWPSRYSLCSRLQPPSKPSKPPTESSTLLLRLPLLPCRPFLPSLSSLGHSWPSSEGLCSPRGTVQLQLFLSTALPSPLASTHRSSDYPYMISNNFWNCVLINIPSSRSKTPSPSYLFSCASSAL